MSDKTLYNSFCAYCGGDYEHRESEEDALPPELHRVRCSFCFFETVERMRHEVRGVYTKSKADHESN